MAHHPTSSGINSFKDIQKSLMNKHKDLFHLLREIENKSLSAKPQDRSKKIIIEYSTMENLLKIASQLLELDQKASQHHQVFKELLSSFDKIQYSLKPLKSHLAETEKTVIKELKSFEKYFKDSLISLKTKTSPFLLRSKIRSVLTLLVHEDTVNDFSKGQKPSYPVHLLKSFYPDMITEEPELEINSGTDAKKFLHYLDSTLKAVEKVAEKLLDVFQEISCPTLVDQKDLPQICVTPNELKMLKFKINRLHNRGSLTDEEAKNMLGKISVIPTSPNNETSEFLIRSDDSIEFCEEDEPVTATHEKSVNVFGRSLSKHMGKKGKITKKMEKRNSTPGKKIVRNTSLPKAMILMKGGHRDKAKQLKIKSKSPHSFV